MPEITVRKRVGKRSGDLKYKSRRWFYRHRPQVAVAVAFLIFVVGGYFIAAATLPNLGNPEPQSTGSTTPPSP